MEILTASTLRHAGARLKGGFSRLSTSRKCSDEIQAGYMSGAMQPYTIYLNAPEGAHQSPTETRLECFPPGLS